FGRETNGEALIVKVTTSRRVAADPSWKYGARRQLAQDWTLDLTDVGTIAGDQRAPRIGEDTILTRERTRCASEREDQQATPSRDCESDVGLPQLPGGRAEVDFIG